MAQQTIRRGSTPTITARVDHDLSSSTAYPDVRMAIRGGTALDLDRGRLGITASGTGCIVAFTLSQEETLAMKPYSKVRVQAKAKSADGSVKVTEIGELAVSEVLDGSVM